MENETRNSDSSDRRSFFRRLVAVAAATGISGLLLSKLSEPVFASNYVPASGLAYFDGPVGIGTATPGNQLTIVSQSSSNSRGIQVIQNNTGAQAAMMNFFKSRNTNANPTAVVNGDYVHGFCAFPFSGSSYLDTAGFLTRVNGTVTGTSVPTDLAIYTKATGTDDPYGDAVVRLVVKPSGAVGIGTTTPPYLFGVYGANPTMCVEESATSNSNITFRRAGANKWNICENYGSPGENLCFYDWASYNRVFMMEAQNGNIVVDPDGLNQGAIHAATNTNGAGLTFGLESGEGIASKRNSGGNQYGLDFYTNFARKMAISQAGAVGINSDPVSYSNIRLRVAGGAITAAFEASAQSATYAMISDGHIVPNSSGVFDCGNASWKWRLVRGVTITSGDLVFENDFRVTEHGTDGLAFVDPQENIIAILDGEGNLHIKGRVIEHEQLGKASPRKSSGASTEKPGETASGPPSTETTVETTSTTPPPSTPPN